MKDRLRQIIDYYQLSTTRFAQKIGVNEGTLRKVLAENTTLRSDTLAKIAETFTEVSIDWLVSGKGEMLRHEAPTATTEPRNDSLAALISILQSTITEKDRQIQHLLDIIHSLTSTR